MENYGIPDEPVAMTNLQEAVDANANLIWQAADGLVRPLIEWISNVDHVLASISYKYLPKLRSAANKNQKAINEVVNGLQGQMLSSINANDALLLGMPHPSGWTPLQPVSGPFNPPTIPPQLPPHGKPPIHEIPPHGIPPAHEIPPAIPPSIPPSIPPQPPSCPVDYNPPSIPCPAGEGYYCFRWFDPGLNQWQGYVGCFTPLDASGWCGSLPQCTMNGPYQSYDEAYQVCCGQLPQQPSGGVHGKLQPAGPVHPIVPPPPPPSCDWQFGQNETTGLGYYYFAYCSDVACPGPGTIGCDGVVSGYWGPPKPPNHGPNSGGSFWGPFTNQIGAECHRKTICLPSLGQTCGQLPGTCNQPPPPAPPPPTSPPPSPPPQPPPTPPPTEPPPTEPPPDKCPAPPTDEPTCPIQQPEQYPGQTPTPPTSIEPCSTDDLCCRIQAIADMYVLVGEQILATKDKLCSGCISSGLLKTLIDINFGPIPHVPFSVLNEIDNLITTPQLYGMVAIHLQAVTNMYGCDTERVRKVYAARSLFIALSEVKFESHITGHGSNQVSGNLAIEIFKLGGGSGWSTGEDNTASLGIAIKQLSMAAINLSDYVLAWECQSQLLEIPDAVEAYLRNRITLDSLRCYLRLNNVNPDLYIPVVQARRETLDADQRIEYARRTGVNEIDIPGLLRDIGWTDNVEAGARVQLYDELPSIQDHLHWMQRNVFDDKYVADYQLMDGFEERFWAKFGSDLRAKGYTKYRAALDYAAHWLNLSPEQLRELVYRLHPDYTDADTQVTEDDFQRLLAEQDIAPWYTKRLKATLYKVPALSYIRDMYRSFLVNDDELKLIHRKLGYSEEDAERFLNIDKLTRARLRASESHGWQPSAIANAYVIGQMDAQTADEKMAELGFTAQESQDMRDRAQADFQRQIIQRARSRMMLGVVTTVKQALAVGVLTTDAAAQALVSQGWPQQFAFGWAGLQAQAGNVALTKQGVARIRGAYLNGEIDSEYATNALSQLGIVPEQIARYTALWRIELTPRRKRRGDAQIVNDVSLNEISTDEALVRLQNLGYDDADQRLYLADAQRKILANEQKAAAAEQRTERGQAAELQRLAADAKRQHKEYLAKLRTLSPPAKMQQFAALGTMGKDVFFARFRTLEYDDTDIERYWEQACAKKNAACTETTPTLPGTIPPTDGSGFPPDSPS